MDVKFIDKSKTDAIINSDNSTTRLVEKTRYTNILRRLPSDENSEQIYERKNEVSEQTKIDIIV